MKSRLIVGAIGITILAIGGYVYYRNFTYVTYEESSEICIWKDGKPAAITGVVTAKPLAVRKIKKADEAKFIAQVSQTENCWYKTK